MTSSQERRHCGIPDWKWIISLNSAQTKSASTLYTRKAEVLPYFLISSVFYLFFFAFGSFMQLNNRVVHQISQRCHADILTA